MKKILPVLLAFGAVQAHAAETAPKVTVGGYLDTQVGTIQQKSQFQHLNPGDLTTSKRQSSAIVNDTKIDFKISAESKHGFKYGGRIRLNADTSSPASDNDDSIADKTMIFVESKFGRLEGGAYDSASKQMQVSANSIATISDGIDGYVPKWLGKDINNKGMGTRYIIWPELLINCDCLSYTNKVTYFTPKVYGFSAGVSYSPDNAVHGTISKARSIPKRENANFRDIFDVGVNYDYKYKDIEYKFGVIGQFGKAKNLDVARKDLKTYEVGAVVTYKGLSLAGSYSDWGKSATPVVRDTKKKYGSKYWTAGAAYEYSNFKTSLTYMQSYRANVFSANAPSSVAQHDRGHNKAQFAVLGFDYKLAPGFIPYAEVAHFRFRDSNGVPANRGQVYLAGTRLKF